MKDSRIRILHVLQTMGVGGMEKRVLRLCRGLDSTIYDIHAVSLRPTDGTMIDWPKDRHHFYPIEPGFHMVRLLGLARLMRNGGYDIVHSHNWATMLYGVLAGRLARVPIVLHGEHGLNDDDRKGVSFKREAVAMVIAQMATRVVTVNEFIKRQAQERWKLSPSKLVSIPNGVDLVRFARGRQAPSENSELVIGTVARFDPIKNIPCMIRGFELFKQSNPSLRTRLVLVGDGPQKCEMQKLASSLDCAQDVIFPGETDRPEEWYSKFDIYINGSFSEGMSNTILEGMACGLPIVASSVPGNQAWLEENTNALFFESDTPQDLCHCLTALAVNRELLRQMGENNRRCVEIKYDNQNFLLRYHRLYQQLLGK